MGYVDYQGSINLDSLSNMETHLLRNIDSLFGSLSIAISADINL